VHSLHYFAMRPSPAVAQRWVTNMLEWDAATDGGPDRCGMPCAVVGNRDEDEVDDATEDTTDADADPDGNPPRSRIDSAGMGMGLRVGAWVWRLGTTAGAIMRPPLDVGVAAAEAEGGAEEDDAAVNVGMDMDMDMDTDPDTDRGLVVAMVAAGSCSRGGGAVCSRGRGPAVATTPAVVLPPSRVAALRVCGRRCPPDGAADGACTCAGLDLARSMKRPTAVAGLGFDACVADDGPVPAAAPRAYFERG